MKKILALIFIYFFLSGLVITQRVHATIDETEQSGIGVTDEPVLSPQFYPPPQNSEGVAILALFDKKGTAKIAAKITVDNEEKQELKDFSVFLPGKNVRLLRAVHEKWLLKKSCDYGYPVPLPMEKLSAPSAVAESQMYPNPQYCPPNYVTVYTSLFPITQLRKDGMMAIISANPDMNNKNQESILLLYEIPKLARKFLTNYHFDILTPQIPLSATTVQAGLLTKDGLYLKGATYYGGSGGYQPNFRALEKAKNLNNEENAALSAFSNDILYQGIVRKSDSDISENSSFEIKGMYGRSMILLYVYEFLTGVAVLAVLIIGIYYLVRFISKKSPDFKPIFQTILVALVTSLIVTLLAVFIIFYLRNSPIFINLLPLKIS